MSGDSPDSTDEGSSETTPTRSPDGFDPSVEILSGPVSSPGPSTTRPEPAQLAEWRERKNAIKEKFFPAADAPPMRVPTGPRRGLVPGSKEARERTEQMSKDLRAIRIHQMGRRDPWRQAGKTLAGIVVEMLTQGKDYAPQPHEVKTFIAQMTLAVLRDESANITAKIQAASQVGRMLGAFGGEGEAEKVRRLLDEAKEADESIPAEALVGGGTNGRTAQ